MDNTRIRKGGHTSIFNLIFDYFFDPNLATNAYARNTYYSHSERKDDYGNRIWLSQFKNTGSILTNHSPAKTGFAIYIKSLPSMPPSTDVQGKHKLYSVEETVEADLKEKVGANQFIDWQQGDHIIKKMMVIIETKLITAANETPKGKQVTLEFEKVEYAITLMISGDKGGFSIVNQNMLLPFVYYYDSSNPHSQPLKEIIADAIRA